MASSSYEHYLDYDNGKVLHYHQLGPRDGELMIFLHGWPGIGKLWYNQLCNFAADGYNVVAPDMPGWGLSTSPRKEYSEYSQENIVQAMLLLLKHLGHSKAIWIAHDWGCATMSSIFRHHPEVCKALCGMTVPYATLEIGLDELVRTANRELYPEGEFPHAQWSYQAYYELEFEKITEWYEKDIRGFLKSMYVKSDPALLGTRSSAAYVVRDGGRSGGAPKPPSPEMTPDDKTIMNKTIFENFVASCEKTGLWTGNAWYMNHAANKAYNVDIDKRIKVPVLFIEAKYDTICDTAVSRLAERQQALCDDLTYISIEAGHHVAIEKGEEVNLAISQWLSAKGLDHCREMQESTWRSLSHKTEVARVWKQLVGPV